MSFLSLFNFKRIIWSFLEEQDVADEGDSELFEDENEAMVEELLNDVKNFDEL